MEALIKTPKPLKSRLPAKLSAPKLSGIYPRPRLFKLLDDAVSCPAVWIQGPGGAGKTTFVANWLADRKKPLMWYQLDAGDSDIASFFYYMGQAASHAASRYKKKLPLLTSEYLLSIPVFTRRYFEELFLRLKPGSVVVFDNYQDVPLESGFHEMMVHAIETIPEGINIVILSRNEPPPVFSRLRVNNVIDLIGWEDMKFTRDESQALLELQGRKDLSETTFESIYTQTEGWAAGLILLSEKAIGETDIQYNIEHATSVKIFDYFASQIFNKTDPLTQRFLITIAFLPSITVSMAEQFTMIGEAEKILERLVQHHYFTQKHILDVPCYQFHALFRTFLLARARSFYTEDELQSIMRKAAILLRSYGRVDETAALLLEAREWTLLIDLILAEANALSIQGRSETLDKWIFSVPEEMRNENAWLLYWAASCRMAFNPAESRTLLENSFNQFRREDNATGAYLSWAAIINTFNYEWGDFYPLDHWISEFEDLQKTYPQVPSREIDEMVAGGMLCAITNRQPSHPDSAIWAERLKHIVLTSQNESQRMMLGNQLIFYYLWIGDFSNCAVLMDSLRPSRSLKKSDALTKQNWYVMEAMYSWLVADWLTCQQAIRDGLKNADESGVHILDFYLLAQGVYGGLTMGDSATADYCFAKMSQINSRRPGDKSLYHYQAASVAWYHGDLIKSVAHGKAAVKIAEEISWPFPMALCLIELAISLFDSGEHEEADTCLAKALDIAQGMIGLEFLISLAGSRFALDRGSVPEGLDFLRRGLTIGARHGILNAPRWNDNNMARLCAIALEHKIEPEYVRRLIITRNLIPPAGEALALDSWPWPIKIFTMGHFAIHTEGGTIDVSDKVHQKPLTLLKVLIAFGAKDVPEDKLTDALWPDADGDNAHQSLKITLHRLRKLFGREDVVVVKKSHYTLDSSKIWIDLRNFVATLSELEKAIEERRHEALSAIANRLMVLHRGHFLEMESAQWAHNAREQLHGRFLRAVLRAANLLVDYKSADAIHIFEKMIEIDPLVENCYEGLMRANKRLGRTSEALSVYGRCVDIMKREFNRSPSSTIEALRAELQDSIPETWQ